jgi:CubicO group peptidase (beta-lactamase class C family)
MPAFRAARRVLLDGAAAHVFPCAVIEVGDQTGVRWREACGRLTFDQAAADASEQTIFDLASLTKVVATTLLAMRMVDLERLRLDRRVADILSSWRRPDRREVRVADLLAHASGLPAHRPFFETCSGRPAYDAAISAEPLAYQPGTQSIYSDLGFIALGFALETVTGETLDVQFDQLRELVEAKETAIAGGRVSLEIGFRLPESALDRVAPTRGAAGQRGLVHDENAAALGGLAGHAGLFGTAGAVGTIARWVLRSVVGTPSGDGLAERPTAARFVSRTGIPGSSRALGWDTMLPTSSCGTRLSARAFGHTGHTGTSLWIDPDAGIYVVQLTNRVYPGGGTAEDIRRFRRALHDAVMAEVRSSNPRG